MSGAQGRPQAPGVPFSTQLGLPKTEGLWGVGQGLQCQEWVEDTERSAEGTSPS